LEFVFEFHRSRYVDLGRLSLASRLCGCGMFPRAVFVERPRDDRTALRADEDREVMSRCGVSRSDL
jgi:hypothetical protein